MTEQGVPTVRPPRPARAEILELDVDSLAHGGRGVARTPEGMVVFVAGALPGDRVRARVTRSKRDFAEAVAVELVTPAAGRVPDECVHGGEPCPGAPWQGLTYEAQLAEKERLLAEALQRIGGLEGFEQEPILATPEEGRWRYRNKTEYSFGPGRGEDDQLALGFHARGRWDEVVDVEDCRLASVANNEARNRVRDWARGHDLEPFDRRAKAGALRNLVVREGRRTGEVQTRLVTTEGHQIPRPPAGLVDLHTIVALESGSTSGPTGVMGSERLTEQLAVAGIEPLTFEISPEAFFQTNTEMAEHLYGTALEYAALTGTERVLDLYCGIGTISLALARRAAHVHGIEIVPDAIADAERNAELNGITNTTFTAADARTAIRPLLAEGASPDVVVIDPPRAGLSAKVVRRVLECEAKRIVYVSCNPTTLAPNARQMVEAGYTLKRVRPVDMFPQTPHIECVALLERG